MTLEEFNIETGVATCKSNHLSRFTANTQMTEDEFNVLITDIKHIHSDDDDESDIFPVMIGVASLLVLIMSTFGIVSLRNRNDQKNAL